MKFHGVWLNLKFVCWLWFSTNDFLLFQEKLFSSKWKKKWQNIILFGTWFLSYINRKIYRKNIFFILSLAVSSSIFFWYILYIDWFVYLSFVASLFTLIDIDKFVDLCRQLSIDYQFPILFEFLSWGNAIDRILFCVNLTLVWCYHHITKCPFYVMKVFDEMSKKENHSHLLPLHCRLNHFTL